MVRASDNVERLLWESEGVEDDSSFMDHNESTFGFSVAEATLGSRSNLASLEDDDDENGAANPKRAMEPRRTLLNRFRGRRRQWQNAAAAANNKTKSPPRGEKNDFVPSLPEETETPLRYNRSSVRTSREGIDGTQLLTKQQGAMKLTNRRLSTYSMDDSSVDYSVMEANNKMRRARLVRRVSDLTEATGEGHHMKMTWEDPFHQENMLGLQEEEDYDDDDDDYSNDGISVESDPSEIVFQPLNRGKSAMLNSESEPPVGFYRYSTTNPLAQPNRAPPGGRATRNNYKTKLDDINEDQYARNSDKAIESKRGLTIGTNLSHNEIERKEELSPLTPGSMMPLKIGYQDRNSSLGSYSSNDSNDRNNFRNYSSGPGNDYSSGPNKAILGRKDSGGSNYSNNSNSSKKGPISPFMLYQLAVIGDASLASIPTSSNRFKKPQQKTGVY